MRYDKYDPISGGFRAALAADTTAAATASGLGVGLDANGEVVAGAGNTGIKGVLILTKDKLAGDIVDVMTDGECVEASGFTAGTVITADTTSGALGTTAPDATNIEIGYTVEATRLVVRNGAN